MRRPSEYRLEPGSTRDTKRLFRNRYGRTGTAPLPFCRVSSTTVQPTRVSCATRTRAHRPQVSSVEWLPLACLEQLDLPHQGVSAKCDNNGQRVSSLGSPRSAGAIVAMGVAHRNTRGHQLLSTWTVLSKILTMYT